MRSHIDDSVITCEEIIDMVAKDHRPETVSINSNGKDAIYKMNCYIFHTFY